MPKILMGHLQLPCRLIKSHVKRYHSSPVLPYNRRLNILCLHQNGKQSLPLVCWCSDQGRGANSCQRHGTTHSGVIARPYWDVGTRRLIVFNFSIVLVKLRPRSHLKSCLLMYNGSWSSVHNPNWGKVGLTGFPGTQDILARLSQTREAV